jgi:hypothetical protein
MLQKAAGSGEVVGHGGAKTPLSSAAGAASAAAAVTAARVMASARTSNERTVSLCANPIEDSFLQSGCSVVALPLADCGRHHVMVVLSPLNAWLHTYCAACCCCSCCPAQELCAIFAKCGSTVFGPPPGVHQSHNFFIVIWFDLIFSAKFRGAGAKLRKKLVPTF